MSVLATAVIWTAALLRAVVASSQYQYIIEASGASSEPVSPLAAASLASVPARSDIECVSLCDNAAAAASSTAACAGVAWCPPPLGCRLLGNASSAGAAASSGCRIFGLSDVGRVSGGWCDWQSWTAWTTACHSGARTRSRLCQCPQPQSTASTGCDRTVDGPGQADQRFLGWADWALWTDWTPAGCMLDQTRQRSRVCSVSMASVDSPNTASTESQGQFSSWCDWQGWSLWIPDFGCHVKQTRSRSRKCSCAGTSTSPISTESTQSDSRFNGWCDWNQWSNWGNGQRSNCIIFFGRKYRHRDRHCACVVDYTASPSDTSSQTESSDCTFLA